MIIRIINKIIMRKKNYQKDWFFSMNRERKNFRCCIIENKNKYKSNQIFMKAYYHSFI